MNKFKLKELQTLKEKKESERSRVLAEAESSMRRAADLKKEITSLNDKIYKSREISSVTEHALLRYLERVKGIDMEEIKKEIMSHVKPLYPLSGQIRGKIDGKDYKFVIKSKQVITVIREE